VTGGVRQTGHRDRFDRRAEDGAIIGRTADSGSGRQAPSLPYNVRWQTEEQYQRWDTLPRGSRLEIPVKIIAIDYEKLFFCARL
jgi:hypothetical protein